MSMTKAVVESASTVCLRDPQILFHIYRFKQALDAGEYVLGHGKPWEVDAKDLLWQSNFSMEDQVGQAYIAFLIWIGVVCHPKTVSASFQVDGFPEGDRALVRNRSSVRNPAGPFRIEITGSVHGPDGFVYPNHPLFKQPAPLEIGAVHPAQLLERLHSFGSFARWPYGSSFVYLFEPLPNHGPFDATKLVSSHLELCAECANRDIVTEK